MENENIETQETQETETQETETETETQETETQETETQETETQETETQETETQETETQETETQETETQETETETDINISAYSIDVDMYTLQEESNETLKEINSNISLLVSVNIVILFCLFITLGINLGHYLFSRLRG